MSTTNLPGSKKRPAREADNLTVICEPIVWKMLGASTSHNLMDLHGLIALPILYQTTNADDQSATANQVVLPIWPVIPRQTKRSQLTVKAAYCYLTSQTSQHAGFKWNKQASLNVKCTPTVSTLLH
jgi:hypothetical protein